MHVLVPAIFKIAIILLVTLLTMQSALANAGGNILTIKESGSAIELTPYISIFEDRGAQLSINDISTPEALSQFKPLTTAPNFGFSHSAWWVKLQIRNNNTETQKFTVRQNYPLIDFIDFYSRVKDGGNWNSYSTGDRRVFDTRPVDFKDFLFPVQLPTQIETTILIRFESSGSINIGLDLHSDYSLLEAIGTNHLATGIYYGGFIILVFYNFLLFVAVRERTFFYYLLYLASYGLFFSVLNGLAFQYFWPNSPWLANQSLIILLSLSLIWSLQFSRSILSIREIAPIANRITTGMMVLSAIPLIISPYVAYKTIIIPVSLITLLCTVQLMAMGFIAFAQGSRPARYYLLAWSALLVGILAYMLKTFGLLPHNAITQNGQQIGSLIEMVLLSIAMGSKVNELKIGSYVDTLTNLSNRRYFDERFEKEFERCKSKNNAPLSLMIIDVDNFKQYNDQYGHQQGDDALAMVGKKLSEVTRKNTLPCRYGGEEFAVILPNTTSDKASIIAERIRSSIEDDNSGLHKLTISIGVATCQNDNFATHQLLFEAVDQTLYLAKENGRNRVEFFQPDLSERTLYEILENRAGAR